LLEDISFGEELKDKEEFIVTKDYVEEKLKKLFVK